MRTGFGLVGLEAVKSANSRPPSDVYLLSGFRLGAVALAQTGFSRVTISACNDFAIRKTKTSLFAPLGVLVRGAIMFSAITQVCCSPQPCYVPVGR